MSLAVEIAELMGEFQWLTIEDSIQVKDDPNKKIKVEEEIADVAICLFNLCNVLDIELSKTIRKRLASSVNWHPEGQQQISIYK